MTEVLAFGTYDRRKHPRVGVLIDGLRRNGCTVTEINQPLGFSTSQRVEILKKPWKLFGFGARMLSLWIRLAKDARRFVRANGRPDAVLVGYMGHFDVLLARLLFPHTPIALDHLIFAADTAKDRGARGLKVRLLTVLDRMALKRADLVIVDTEEHRRMLRAEDQSLVVPVGAPCEWYAAGSSLTGETNAATPSLVFYGLFTPLQGTPVIARAIRILAARGITPPVSMVGAGQDDREVQSILHGMRHVEFIPWLEPEELPTFVARHTISLGIFSTTPKGLHVVPNKVYQSMAAGTAVITSDTPPQRRMLGNGAVFTKPGSAEALADAIESLVRHPDRLAQAKARAKKAAEGFTEQEVTKQLSRWVESTHASHR